GPGAAAFMAQHICEPIPVASEVEPSVPARWDAILAACLAKDPEHRIASMKQLIERLGGAAAPPAGVNDGEWSTARSATAPTVGGRGKQDEDTIHESTDTLPVPGGPERESGETVARPDAAIETTNTRVSATASSEPAVMLPAVHSP